MKNTRETYTYERVLAKTGLTALMLDFWVLDWLGQYGLENYTYSADRGFMLPISAKRSSFALMDLPFGRLQRKWKCSRGTIYYRIKKGRLPAIHEGRRWLVFFPAGRSLSPRKGW